MSHAVSEQLLCQFSEFLATRTGLYFPEERRRDLERAVNAAAKELAFEDAEACARWFLTSPATRRHVEILASYLTVGETYFFRDRKCFDALEYTILPESIRSRAGTERRLRIWSAGCCTGEEPYSIAMLLAKMIPDLSDWNISLLATDINPRFLHKASLGIYNDWSFRDAPRGIKEAFFSRTKEGRFKIAPRIKALVTFAYLNLAEDVYPSVENGTNAMDIIFCRNVVMYFEPSRGKKVLQNLGLSLMEDGWLFVSPVEISQVALPQLEAINFPGAVAYRKSSSQRDARRAFAELLPSLTTASDISALPVNLNAAEKPAATSRPVPVQETGIFHGPEAEKEKAEPLVAQTPYQEAWASYEQGCYAEVARKILETLSQDSNDAKAMALLARAYANQGRLADALAWCEKAVAADKLNAGWCYLLATILQEQGLDEGAVTALKRALYLDQNYALAHFALGNLTRRQGKLKDSERHFGNALSILSGYRQEHVLPESEGITAGRLAEIIRSTVSSEVWA